MDGRLILRDQLDLNQPEVGDMYAYKVITYLTKTGWKIAIGRLNESARQIVERRERDDADNN